MPRFLLLLILALTGLALTGLAQAPPATDAQIEAQLHDRLAKSVVGKDGFTVKVKGGVVYWEGTTPVAQHKGAATRMAKSSGARRVVNNIKVKKAGGSPAPPTPPKPTARAVPAPAAPGEPVTVPLADPLRRVTVKWR